MTAKAVSKYILLIMAALGLSVTTVIFGALPMRVLYRGYGRGLYWIGMLAGALLASGLLAIPYGILVLALAAAVSCYAEVENHGGSVFSAGFGATLVALGLGAIGVGGWLAKGKIHLLDELHRELAPVADKILELNSSAAISIDSMIQQLPSGLVIGIILALAISLLAEDRLTRLMGLPKATKGPMGVFLPVKEATAGGDLPTVPVAIVRRTEVGAQIGQPGLLTEYRVPDIFIWLAIASIFGAFYRHGVPLAETISLNIINVLVVCYFFQGLAVAAKALRVYRVGTFWRNIWYAILVLQLFLLVSFVGFADFWLDFRERLARKPIEPNKGF